MNNAHRECPISAEITNCLLICRTTEHKRWIEEQSEFVQKLTLIEQEEQERALKRNRYNKCNAFFINITTAGYVVFLFLILKSVLF